MSVRTSSASVSTTNSGLRQKAISRVVEIAPPRWVRNPSWPPCDANVGDEKLVFLNAVFDGLTPTATNHLAFATSGGSFTVNFGDGTVTNYAANATVEYIFSFNSPALDGTNAPVTLVASTDTVNRTAHGYTDGMLVTLYNVTSTPEVSSGQSFYVVNATADTFQISATSGGSPILFSVDGTATLLPYKIATVTITPQAGQSLATLSFDRRHSAISSAYATNILDMCVAFSTLNSLAMGNIGFVRHRSIERFRILQMTTSGTVNFDSLCTDMAQLQSVTIAPTNISGVNSMFLNCASLRYAPEMTLTSVTGASNMFSGCRALYSTPSYNMPSCTTFTSMFANCVSLREVGTITGSSVGVAADSMFNNCNSLVTAPKVNGRLSSAPSMFAGCTALLNVPAYDTSSVTNFGAMFQNCASLETAPLLNMQSATSLSSMFSGCRALVNVPLYNTQNVTSMFSLFALCTTLQSVPLFNTQNVTDMSSMFNACSSLRSVPLFNTQNVTNMSGMFNNCVSLVEVPFFNTQNVTNMSSMFTNCTSLYTVPRFNTSRNVNMSSMFSGCTNLEVVPQFDTRLSTNVTTMFSGCTTLTTVPAFDFSSAASLNNLFLNCSNLINVPAFTTSPTGLTIATTTFSGCIALSQIGRTDLSGVTSSTNFNSIFQNCTSLARMQCFGMRFSFSVANGVLSKGALEEIFNNLATASSATITVTNNFGIGASATSASSTSTAGSTVINTVNTSGVAVGMLAIGTNCPVSSTVNGTADVTANTITAVAHGLTDGRKIAFSSLSGLGVVTGVSVATIYYVVNATADTFQVASTVGGAPIDLGGTSGAVTFRYPNYVVSVNPGVSITMDAPQARTGTSTITFRTLDISSATLKNWTVTT